MNRSPISQRLLARCFGAIGSAVISGDTGFISCARKPFCSPLAQFSTWRERMFPYPMCLPVPNEPIGGSVGSNVSLAMLVSLPPHYLRSPFMVSRSALLKHLALMWRWLLNSSKTPLASFFRISSFHCAFNLLPYLLISSFHGTLPVFSFMKLSSPLLLSACFHLVAYLVGGRLHARGGSYWRAGAGERKSPPGWVCCAWRF